MFVPCGTYPIPSRLIAWGATDWISCPSKAIHPLRGWRNPKTAFSRVDLPAPFGPMTPVIEPASTLSRIPFRMSISAT